MFMRRDFDLNSVDVYADSAHVYTDSLKEVFRKTMVTQEIIFQNQVHELHRIYGTQRTLMMQNNSWIEFDRYNSNYKVGSANSESQEFLEECQGVFYNLQQRPLAHVGHPHSLKLSLSIGDKNNRKQSGKRTWFDVNLARDVIDLDDSTDTMSNDDTGHEQSSARADMPVDSRSMHESQKSVVTDHERTSFDRDLERCDLVDLNESLSSQKQQRSPCVMLDLDLNKAYCDDSSCQSNDPMITHPSTASSSHASDELVDRVDGDFQSKGCNNFSDETSGIAHHDDAQNCVPVSLKGNYERAETCADESHISDKVLDSEEDGNVEHASETLNSQTQIHLAAREAKCEKGKSEDVVVSYSGHGTSIAQEVHSDTSSSSHKTCHVGDNESSNAENMKSEVKLGNPASTDRSLDSSELDKVDVLVREAAESLVHIAFETSASYQDYCEENNETAVIQFSSDSFELFTLGLKDCADDDLCVSSKLSEVEVAENKDYGLKIRRGRRLKDFQRDILPGMASLSRHEIREDINILEGVLRSREYRKMQAKMANDGHSWCMPTRSRRSRLNCAKRRRYS